MVLVTLLLAVDPNEGWVSYVYSFEHIQSSGPRWAKLRFLMQLLYRKPIVTVNDVADFLDITPKSANMLIGEFVGLDILHEITGQRRNRVFGFTEHLRLFEQD